MKAEVSGLKPADVVMMADQRWFSLMLAVDVKPAQKLKNTWMMMSSMFNDITNLG